MNAKLTKSCRLLKAIVLAICMLSWAQLAQAQGNVSGIVTDYVGEPLVGASVAVQGSSVGVLTDVNGAFSVPAKAGDVLKFSYIGYVTQEVKVGNNPVINVTLAEDKMALDEVVVVGYGAQKKVNLTGSVASVTAEDIVNKPVMSTSQALAGLVPGLSVISDTGKPGASADLKIRGTGTFSSAGNDPLVLIDGMSGNIDDIDPNDIQSISFLKDAASASIYGNRAANGVILVETKKGSEGRTIVSYSNNFGWQKAAEMPELLDSWEYATYMNMAMKNMGKEKKYSDEEIQKFKDGSDPDNYPNVNHLKWVLESGNGFQNQHNIGVKGGTSRLQYNLSLGYRNQNGLTAKTYNRRFTGLFNFHALICKGLNVDVNMNAYSNTYNEPGPNINEIVGYSVREYATIPGKKSNGFYGHHENYAPEAYIESESFSKTLTRNFAGQLQLRWDTPVQGLSFRGKASASFKNISSRTFTSKTQIDENYWRSKNELSLQTENTTYTSFDGLGQYERNFGQHYINLLLGASYEISRYEQEYAYRHTFPNNLIYELSAGDASTSSNDSSSWEWSLISIFGRVNYSFADRYLIEANFRYDGSSRFARNNRWGFFPSVSAGWRISEENFWKEGGINNWFNNLKIRASYGVLGNQNIGMYPYQQVYSIGHNPVYGNPASLSTGAYIGTFNNANVTWEKTSVTDVGIDFGFFNNRLSGTIDYFYKYTKDILAPVERTMIMGRDVGLSNVGAVSNRGVEISLSWNGRIGSDFNYSITPNFTYVKNRVEKLSDGKEADVNNGRWVGEPLGVIYGYVSDGLFVDQAEINNACDQLVSKSDIKPGYVKYQDISGPDGVPDGKVDSNYDRKILGSTLPKFYYGLNITAAWKGIDLGVLFQGMGGHKRKLGSYMACAFYNDGNIQRWQADNAWTEENPNKWAEYPRIETMSGGSSNLQLSDYWVRDASFLRLKNVQLGYSLPRNIIKKVGLSRLRIYVSGENLYTWKKFYKGWDPENYLGEGDQPHYYPVTRIFSFGLNLNF